MRKIFMKLLQLSSFSLLLFSCQKNTTKQERIESIKSSNVQNVGYTVFKKFPLKNSH